MKKRFSKPLSLILTLFMLLSMIPAGLFGSAGMSAFAADSAENEITVGQRLNVEVGEGETVYLRFTPEFSGSYAFRSFGDNDTYGYLFNEEKEPIIENDDADDDEYNNFRIDCDLEEGVTYYFGVRYCSGSESGSFDVLLSVTCAHENAEERDRIEPTCQEEGREAGVYCPDCDRYVSGGEVIYCLPHVFGEDYYIETEPTCSEYGIEKTVCTVCGVAEDIRYVDKLPHTDEDEDGRCDMCGCYISDVYMNESANYELSYGEPVSFKIVPSVTQEYLLVYTTGNLDISVCLADADMNTLVCKSTGEDENEGRIRYTMEEGRTYYLIFENLDENGGLYGGFWFYPMFDFEYNDGTAKIVGSRVTYCHGEPIIIPEKTGDYTITEIGNNAFQYISDEYGSYASLTLPSTLKKIGQYAFVGAEFDEVYFDGYENRWNEIDIQPGNESITDRDIIFKICEHTDTEAIEEVPATCSETGCSAGVKCLECGVILSGCEVISRIPHTDEDGDGICDICGFSTDNEIFPGEKTTVYCGEEQTAYLKFTPAVTGSYLFRSFGEGYKMGFLCDQEKCEMQSVYGEDYYGGNFFLTVDLIAGTTYYLAVSFMNEEESGDVQVLLTLECDHSQYHEVDAVEPNCTEGGTSAGLVCDVCGWCISGLSWVEPLGHDFTDYVITVAPDCLNTGTEKGVCSRCGEEDYRDVEKGPHSDENGDYLCDVCGIGLSSDIVAGERITVTLEAGDTKYFKFVPEVSGLYSFVSFGSYDTYGSLNKDRINNIIADNDDWGEDANFRVEFDLTAGVIYYLGARFLNSNNFGSFDVLLTLECTHENTEEVGRIEPTCTEDGREAGVICRDCGRYMSGGDRIYALGHNADGYAVITEPTCTSQGKAQSFCTRCGESYEYELDKIPHSDSDEDGRCDMCDCYISDVYTDSPKLVYIRENEPAVIKIVPQSTQEYLIDFCIDDYYADFVFSLFDKDMNLLTDESKRRVENNECLIRYNLAEGETYYVKTEYSGDEYEINFWVYLYPFFSIEPIGNDSARITGSMARYSVDPIVIPSRICDYTIIEIGECAFNWLSDYGTYPSLTLPSTLVKIANEAFYYSDFDEVYFDGYENQWNNIEIGAYNESITDKVVFKTCDHSSTVEVPEVPATCTAEGYTAGILCEECGLYISGHEIIEKLPHTDDNGDGICDVCGRHTDNDIEVDERMTVSITSGEITCLRFTPDVTGLYSFRSFGNEDTFGYVFNADKEELRNNDDYYDGNFCVSYNLEAGKTYYFGARYYNENKSGSFDVLLTLDCTHEHTEQRDRFEPTCTICGFEAGVYCFDCNSYISGGEMINALGHQLGEYTVTDEPTCSSYGYEEATCTVCGETERRRIEKTDHTDENGDGVCDICSAKFILTLDEPFNVSVNPGERVYLKFVPEVSGSYTFESLSQNDTQGAVYDADKNRLQYNDNGGNDMNFKVRYYLEAGETYYFSAEMVYEEDGSSFDVLLKMVSDLVYNIVSDDDETYAVITGYMGRSDYVAIPDEFEGYPVKEIGDEAFIFKYGIKTLVIPSSVVNISNAAFYSMHELEEVIFEEGSQLEYIAGYAFYNCSSLERITLPASLKSISPAAFYNCCSLTEVDIPSSVETIDGEAFALCNLLEEVTIPESVTKIGSRAFGYVNDNQFKKDSLIPKEGFIIRCARNSAGLEYAIENGFEYVIYGGDCAHENTEIRNAKPATCTEEGYTGDTWCLDCGEQIGGGHAISKTDHTFGEGVVTLEPTCTAKGVKTLTCENCGFEKEEEIPALGHDFAEEWTVDVPATCAAEGSESRHCSRCGEKTDARPIAVTDHTWNDGVITTAPSCTSTGVMTYTCTVCGAVKTEDLNALSHVPGEARIENEVAATCTEDGSYDEAVYCKDCGTELSRITKTVEKLGHTPEVIPAVEPTCTESGLTEGKKCSVCGVILDEQEIVPAKGHTPADAIRENVVLATCTEDGSYDEVVYCSECEAEISRESGKVIPATGHTPEVIPAVEPTCTATGLAEGSKCSVCGVILTAQDIVPAKGHTPGEVKIENEKAATCTAKGSYDEVTYCTVCGAEVTRNTVETDMISHTPGAAAKENVKPASCVREGSYDNVVRCTVCRTVLSSETISIPVTEHTYVTVPAVSATCTVAGLTEGSKCSVCGRIDIPQQIVPALGHSAASPVRENEVAATCTKEGSFDEVVYCSRCSAELSRKAETIPMVEHTPVAVPAMEATCTETGLTEGSKCSVCGVILTPQETTPAKGHAYKDTVTKPTCTGVGYTTHTCLACGHKYTDSETPATGHTYDSGKVTKAATYTATGVRTYTCAACGATKTEKIAKLKVPTVAQIKSVASKSATKSITISWGKVKNADKYEVYRSTDGKKWTKIATVTKTTYTDKKVSPGKSYQYKVRGVHTASKARGSFSPVLKVGTLTAAPTVTLKSSKAKTAVASWKKVTGAKKYIVYKSTNGKKWSKVATTAKTTYTLTKLSSGKKIYVKVVAVNAYGKNSADSAVKNVKVK